MIRNININDNETNFYENMEDFQLAAVEQGENFHRLCIKVLRDVGMKIVSNPLNIPTVGIELSALTCIDNRNYHTWQFRGSWRGNRASLLRTDTVKKVIANAWLLKKSANSFQSYPHYVIYNNFPASGSARIMIDVAVHQGLIDQFIHIMDLNTLRLIAVG